MELEKLQLLAQLADSMENATDKLERAYKENDSETFRNSKNAILDFQQKILQVLEHS